ncbi:A/G-specific adenine glycosylase [Pontibacter sp. G13]|uniref:A/G-specific adenine glycosylase n=1 Tax=Pontibacter sp. G13 TaxID=3074898 RepID=UPI00288C5C74|nr:A/G-specific adenine glycosylase [Pontibacter sp. G13]WNJ20818.1 A/G-specific adenine glycosylase [Pontibacter sp. G13]
MPQIGPLVVQWFAQAGRHLDWRETRDPYRIWVSEIIFQQTRIQQGQGYFHRFMERFPSLEILADADLDEVLKYWEGLGYYSRARNIHAAAHQLMGTFEGAFPQTVKELLALKGVGPYTARAIGSFAFDLPVGVLDGNVIRVVSRMMALDLPVDKPKVRALLQERVDEWASQVDSRSFNNGMMDIGSTICTPTQPKCPDCPLLDHCQAASLGTQTEFPKKTPKAKRKVKYFHFFFAPNQEGEFPIRKRPEKGLWGGLWEIPNEEVSKKAWENQQTSIPAAYLGQLKHAFTHFDMMINVFHVTHPDHQWEADTFIPTQKIPIFAFSKAVLNIFELVENHGEIRPQ